LQTASIFLRVCFTNRGRICYTVRAAKRINLLSAKDPNMKVNTDILQNTVRAANQVSEKFKLCNTVPGGKKVLFLGNSITLHETAPAIGWPHNWGMAASREENDYVHLVLAAVRQKYGEPNYCIANAGNWELRFWDEAVLSDYRAAQTFSADLVIVRLGENVNREALSAHDFAACLDTFISYFAASHSRVICTDLFWEYEPLNRSIAAVCEKRGDTLVHIGDLGYADENKALGLFEHAGVALHPGDLGMRRIADRIIAAL